MAKFLFVTVGVGKEADIAHGIEELVKRENPDKLILVCSKDSKEKIAEPHLLGKEAIKRCSPECYTLTDVNDVKKIYSDSKSIIDGYLNRYKIEENDYVADFTTGTKPMSVGLSLAAVVRGFQHLSYVSGERGEAGRVISGTEDPRVFYPFEFYMDRDLARAVELFNCHQFKAAENIILHLRPQLHEPHFEKKVDFFIKVVRGFWEWDRFHLSEALRIFTDVTRDEESLDFLRALGLKSKVESAKQYLYQGKDNRYSEGRALDLFQNALRRMEEGKFDDAVARFYRLMEFLAQQTLKTKHNIETDQVDVARLPEEARALFTDFPGANAKVSMEKGYQLLEKLGDPLGHLISDARMKELQRKRNYSILAHGFEPVAQKDCEEFKEILLSWLKMSFPNFEKLQPAFVFPRLERQDVERLFQEEAVAAGKK